MLKTKNKHTGLATLLLQIALIIAIYFLAEAVYK